MPTTDQTEVDRLKRNNKMLIIAVIICILLAIVGLIVAIYAVTKDDSDQASSACDGVQCSHGGTCINLNQDNYMCSCVPPFYGKQCQHGG